MAKTPKKITQKSVDALGRKVMRSVSGGKKSNPETKKLYKQWVTADRILRAQPPKPPKAKAKKKAA